MKHLVLYSLTLTTLLLLSACSSEIMLEEPLNNASSRIRKIMVTLPELSIVDDADTRAEYAYDSSKDAFSFIWSDGDVVGVYPDRGSQIDFPINPEDVGHSSAFFDGGGWALETESFYSLYFPYDYSFSDKYAIPLDYRDQKQLAKNDFSHLFNYNYFSSKEAVWGDESGVLDFKVGYLGTIYWMPFTMPEAATLTKLRLISSDVPFMQTAYLDISGSTPVVNPGQESTTVTMKLDNLQVSAGELVNFYMWVLPRDFTSGTITAEVVTSDRVVYIADVTPSVPLEAGTFRRFKRGASGQKPITRKSTLDPEVIEFADHSVEVICLDNWDTNCDRELDMAEAAAVTTLGNVFYGNRTIASFDELKYFTGLTEINKDAFGGCDLLHTLTVPDNVKTICERAFLGCGSLYYLTLPEGLERIETSAFNACINMGAISIPNSVKNIGAQAFYQSKNAAWVDLPSELLEIGESAFSHSTPISEVDFSESEKLVKIGKEAFYACTTLQEAVFPKSLTTIDEGAFDHCWNLRKIVIPNDAVISIDERAFDNSDCPIYVPSALVEDYKSTYPQYAERFSNLEAQEGGTVISNPDMQGGW